MTSHLFPLDGTEGALAARGVSVAGDAAGPLAGRGVDVAGSGQAERGSVVGGAEIGPSEDPATLTITETTWGPDLQGSVGQVAGLMRVTKVKAELATKLNNLSLAMLRVARKDGSRAAQYCTVAGVVHV